MAMKRYMHKRNIFRNKRIEFKYFIEKYDFFKKAFVSEEDVNEIDVDFKNPVCLAALSKALLMEYFSLEVELPTDRLIPTVPLRLNYILWLEDIASALKKNNTDIKVFDIGCGASCIYGLLGSRKYSWSFLCSDIDSSNIEIAKCNIIRNNLQEKIALIKTEANNNNLLEPALTGVYKDVIYDFVMFNPPFFANIDEKCGISVTRNSEKRDVSKTLIPGTRDDTIHEGGEIEMVKNLIEESRKYQNRVLVYTVMLGRKVSSIALKKYSDELNITNNSVYEFCQGRVMRWGFAWSFQHKFTYPVSEFQLARQTNKQPLKWDIPNTIKEVVYSQEGVMDFLRKKLTNLSMKFIEQKTKQSDGAGIHLLVTAKKNTWSHQRRQKRQEEGKSRPVKRRKLDENTTNSVCHEGNGVYTNGNDEEDENLHLKFTVQPSVQLASSNKPFIQLQMNNIEGDREYVNQILTYFKNNLK